MGHKYLLQVDSSKLEAPELLQWKFTSGLAEALESALAKFNTLSSSVDLHIHQFNAYGKTHIKKSDSSPDAYIQVRSAQRSHAPSLATPACRPTPRTHTRMRMDGRMLDGDRTRVLQAHARVFAALRDSAHTHLPQVWLCAALVPSALAATRAVFVIRVCPTVIGEMPY